MFSWDFESKMTELFVANKLKELEKLKKEHSYDALTFDDEVIVEKEVLKELKNNYAGRPVELAHLYNILVGLHTRHSTLIKTLDMYILNLQQRQMMQNAPKVKKQ